MTEEAIKKTLAECFKEVLNKYLFELDTEQNRQLILYEFTDKCAENEHGVEAELIIEDLQLKGVEYIHESGLHGRLMLSILVSPDEE